MNNDLENVIRNQKAEIKQLKEILEYNTKKIKETRGRKQKLKDPLTEHMAFMITKEQKKDLISILKENKIDLSTFVRQLIFGDE